MFIELYYLFGLKYYTLAINADMIHGTLRAGLVAV